MKNIFYIIIIAIISYSCKDKTEKLNESISGTWKLERMEYQDSTGITKVINDSDIKLIFDFENIQEANFGFQIIGNDSLRFEYYLYSDVCNFMFKMSDIKRMPIDAIGRMQVYNFDNIDKNTIEFYTDIEAEYANNLKTLKNTSYLYTKIDK